MAVCLNESLWSNGPIKRPDKFTQVVWTLNIIVAPRVETPISDSRWLKRRPNTETREFVVNWKKRQKKKRRKWQIESKYSKLNEKREKRQKIKKILTFGRGTRQFLRKTNLKLHPPPYSSSFLLPNFLLTLLKATPNTTTQPQPPSGFSFKSRLKTSSLFRFALRFRLLGTILAEHFDGESSTES